MLKYAAKPDNIERLKDMRNEEDKQKESVAVVAEEEKSLPEMISPFSLDDKD